MHFKLLWFCFKNRLNSPISHFTLICPSDRKAGVNSRLNIPHGGLTNPGVLDVWCKKGGHQAGLVNTGGCLTAYSSIAWNIGLMPVFHWVSMSVPSPSFTENKHSLQSGAMRCSILLTEKGSLRWGWRRQHLTEVLSAERFVSTAKSPGHLSLDSIKTWGNCLQTQCKPVYLSQRQHQSRSMLTKTPWEMLSKTSFINSGTLTALHLLYYWLYADWCKCRECFVSCVEGGGVPVFILNPSLQMSVG